MEILNNTEAQSLHTTAYPEAINETKSVINPQALLWAIIAVTLFIIYRQQPDKDTTLGIVQNTLVIVSAVKIRCIGQKNIYVNSCCIDYFDYICIVLMCY